MNELSDEENYSPKQQELLRQEQIDQQRHQDYRTALRKKLAEEEGKKAFCDNRCLQFLNSHPIVYVVIGVIVMVMIILAIVLPLTLIKPRQEQEITPRCPDGKFQQRIDCLPDKNNLLAAGASLEQACRSRSCCWSPTPDQGGPNCVFHYNYGFRMYKTKESSFATQWYELLRMNSPPAFTRSDIANLEFKLEMHTDSRLRVRIFPRRNFKNKMQRWEVPSGVMGENLFKPEYRVEYSDLPFSFKIIRNSTNTTIFDTTQTSIIFSDQFLQITTRLSSPNVFGIGEINKDEFLNDINFKSLPMFASLNHPNIARDKISLYSQFPSYLNIEPDGNSHLVVFYNSNPSEIYLTPFPSLTFRSIGGILDMYIFTGPTPVQAIEQFQQAFGLPKLPPYWSLGLQIGAKEYTTAMDIVKFLDRFRKTKLGFDSILVRADYMDDATMFTLNEEFHELNNIVDKLRTEHRATIIEILPTMGNNTQNYPFSEGVSREKYWILENFFSSSVVGKLLNRSVVYPDFSMEKTREWWKDALERFFFTDKVIKFDGFFLDYLNLLDETLNKTCPNNKWNNPPYKFDFLPTPISNGTLCMDSRYEMTKHYNMHGVYSHYMIESTAKALDYLVHNRTLIMTRHAFLGSGQYSAKWLGEYSARWEDFRKSVVSMIEMNMFGFSQAGSDVCGFEGEIEIDLCENWIKASGMSPFMKLIVETGDDDDTRFEKLIENGLLEVLNASICLRYSLLPYLYTQYYKSTVYGSPVVRPLAFMFPTDVRTHKISNQWMWGDKLMVSIGTQQGGLSSVYVPKGEWFDYYQGFMRESNGDMMSVQTRRNETSLLIRGGSVIFKQDCKQTAAQSSLTFIDIIIALNVSDNYTARGELFIDDSKRKNTHMKENYHRLIDFNVYRDEDDGIIEVRKKSGRYLTNLAYRNLIIMGLKSKPLRITVNENSQSVDGSKTVWDDVYKVYYVNLQTEVIRKVVLDTEYLSLRWTEGFEPTRMSNLNNNNNINNNNNFFNNFNNLEDNNFNNNLLRF